jgi:hypothetical protein
MFSRRIAAATARAMFFRADEFRLREAAQRRTYLRQASAEHFQQSAEFLPLRNRG